MTSLKMLLTDDEWAALPEVQNKYLSGLYDYFRVLWLHSEVLERAHALLTGDKSRPWGVDVDTQKRLAALDWQRMAEMASQQYELSVPNPIRRFVQPPSGGWSKLDDRAAWIWAHFLFGQAEAALYVCRVSKHYSFFLTIDREYVLALVALIRELEPSYLDDRRAKRKMFNLTVDSLAELESFWRLESLLKALLDVISIASVAAVTSGWERTENGTEQRSLDEERSAVGGWTPTYPLKHWAKVFDKHPNTLAKWFREGTVEARKVGSSWAVAPHEVPKP